MAKRKWIVVWRGGRPREVYPAKVGVVHDARFTRLVKASSAEEALRRCGVPAKQARKLARASLVFGEFTPEEVQDDVGQGL